MSGPHRGASTQHHNQQVLAKPQHQPSKRDQQAREKLRQKAKIKSHAYVQLGEKVLQTTSNIHTGYTGDSPFTHFSLQYNRLRFTSYIVCYTRRHQLHANY